MPAGLTWVNHASFLLQLGATRLVTDPWLFGDAFNHGWDLLARSVFHPEDFRDVSHIWISHEHPDHFAPAVLSAIPEDARGGIEVLYQDTPDKRVVSFCRARGFPTRELRDREWLELGPGFRICAGRVPFYDSWLLAEVDGLRLLDWNDCEPPYDRSLREVAEFTGGVDVLFTQFSYANRIGDVDETDKRRAAARQKLAAVKRQIELFRPTHTVLCASFIRFSHEENDYLNDAVNTPERASDFVRDETDSVPLVFYPGDTWDLRSPVDCSGAIERYRDDRERGGPRHAATPTDLETVRARAAAYVDRMRAQNNPLLVWLAANPLAPLLPTLSIHLTDLDCVVDFDLRRGLRTSEIPKRDATLWTSAENLAFAFEHDFGGDTLYVNGRFRCPNGGHDRVLRAFSLGTLNNTGRKLGFSLAFDRAFVGRALQVLFLRAGFQR